MEKDFKEKLEERRIQPSEMAWDRLDAMLSVAENKKPAKKNRTWMYMAASFLVFLLVGVLFLSQEKENSGIETDNSIVTNENNETEAVGESGTIIVPGANEGAVAAKVESSSGNTKKAHSAPVKNNMPVLVNEQHVLPQESIASNDQKVTPVLVRDNSEKLLADAIADETPKKKSKVKVDPNSLLSAVEEEMDDSFRTRVLIGASKNFKAVRSAVANRNYE